MQKVQITKLLAKSQNVASHAKYQIPLYQKKSLQLTAVFLYRGGETRADQQGVRRGERDARRGGGARAGAAASRERARARGTWGGGGYVETRADQEGE